MFENVENNLAPKEVRFWSLFEGCSGEIARTLQGNSNYLRDYPVTKQETPWYLVQREIRLSQKLHKRSPESGPQIAHKRKHHHDHGFLCEKFSTALH